MNLNVKGAYSFTIPITTMFLNTKLKIKGHNIITRVGEAFFLYRCIDNDLCSPINYIVIGNGTLPPKRTDRKLSNERLRKKCSSTVEIDNKRIILSCNVTVDEISDATEIGVISLNSKNEDLLISHDVYNKIDQTVFSGISGEINIEYIYQFTTSFQKNAWSIIDETNNIFYSYEENTVIRVFENNSGYRSVSSLEELKNHDGAFYQDLTDKILYIKPIGDLNNSDIIVQV
ncbi:hypothetical protein [uncultured Methanobrevibacter sp.]|uniref:hypothetical protein n=1 Tax=uncultured Methanobrevibacter sp. TaxID=253161 RepID=UPI0025EA4250|nr:hypothetical protein [uncultured Methanobrevibacter sp.]